MNRLVIFLLVIGMAWAPATVYAISMNDFRLNGFIDLEYEKADGPGNPVKPVGDENGSFDQYHFNLLMEFPVNDQLTVKGHLEFEHSPKVPKTGDIKVEWAFLEYAFNNSMIIRGGSFLTPAGIYNEIHDAATTYNSVRTPWGIYRADKLGGFAMFPKFSTGINFLGSHSFDGDLQINYVVYVLNGENTSNNNDAEKDDNRNKAVGGRLMLSPVSGLIIGSSYYTGKKGTAEDDHSVWIGSLDYSSNQISIRAEYASSELSDTTESGWYSELSYRVNRVAPYIRIGMLDPDTGRTNDEWTELVYGINYEIQPNFIVKLENRHFGGETNNLTVSEDYNEVGAAVNVAF